ncbi:hypothetical protein CVT24_000277 [Panaeolus cyanescens]|uniref:Arrestin-like N-terminal domain-containing protein n=1 Tax=Panaeolus cyanescens TaxID=181874 RepID=A0A409YD91_9AGAR|nr:hypothetical protein CVT24_000277 [Panaeolus cyanescens]
MSIAVLPSYSSCRFASSECSHESSLPDEAVQEPPTYSFQPYADEETVAFTPRMGPTTPNGNFVRCWPQATLILRDQDPEARLPRYGRGGRVIGELGLKSTSKVVKVTATLFGEMSLSVADCGTEEVILVDKSQVLWQDDEQDVQQNRCPSILPIYIQFPQVYQLDGKNYRLPPSFEATFLGLPALFARCIYTLSVTITRTRSYRLASWTTHKTYITMVNFRPRSRPQRPVVLLDSVFASIKPLPEEWLQVVSTMDTRFNSGMRPIECHFFIPSVQTFGISDSIPFHVQLCSSIESLRELLPPNCSLLKPDMEDSTASGSEDGHAPKRRHSLRADSFVIKVSIARQVAVEMQGKRRFRSFTLGTGTMTPVPPFAGSSRPQQMGCYDMKEGDVVLDWKGEVKCWQDVNTGGFASGNLLVKVRASGFRKL